MDKSRKLVKAIVNEIFDPAGGRPQSGMVKNLDLRMVVRGQVLKLLFNYNVDHLKKYKDDITDPELKLEVVSAGKGEQPAHFRVLEFHRFCFDFDKDFCKRKKVSYPPQEIWLWKTGFPLFWNGYRSIEGSDHFLRAGNDLLCQFMANDGKEVLMIADHLCQMHISAPFTAAN